MPQHTWASPQGQSFSGEHGACRANWLHALSPNAWLQWKGFPCLSPLCRLSCSLMAASCHVSAERRPKACCGTKLFLVPSLTTPDTHMIPERLAKEADILTVQTNAGRGVIDLAGWSPLCKLPSRFLLPRPLGAEGAQIYFPKRIFALKTPTPTPSPTKI